MSEARRGGTAMFRGSGSSWPSLRKPCVSASTPWSRVTDAADPGNAEARSAGQEGPSHDEGAMWGDVERAPRASAEVRDTPSAELTSTEDARQTKKDRTWNRVLRLVFGVILLVLL